MQTIKLILQKVNGIDQYLNVYACKDKHQNKLNLKFGGPTIGSEKAREDFSADSAEQLRYRKPGAWLAFGRNLICLFSHNQFIE